MNIFFCHRLCVSCLSFDFFRKRKVGGLAKDTSVQERSFEYLTGLEEESQKGLAPCRKKGPRHGRGWAKQTFLGYGACGVLAKGDLCWQC